MARGTFANIRLVNKFLKGPGPKTLHIPSNDEVSLFYNKNKNKFFNIISQFMWHTHI